MTELRLKLSDYVRPLYEQWDREGVACPTHPTWVERADEMAEHGYLPRLSKE